MLWDQSVIDKEINACHEVIDRALDQHPSFWAGLVSGGHDSICANHIASLHPKAPKPYQAIMIDTGIGAKYTTNYVKERCEQFGWELSILKSPRQEDSFEQFVRDRGLPGPGRHAWVYARIKERVIQQLSQENKQGQRPVMFITGSRRRESQRRMGYAVAVRRGDGFYPCDVCKRDELLFRDCKACQGTGNGNLRQPSRLWAAPCIEWMPANQTLHMDEFGIPRNKIKDLIGLSGECFCGSNAGEDDPGKKVREREIIDSHPLLADVKERIEFLERLAKDSGHHNACVWGQAPKVDDTPSQVEWEELPLFSMDLCIGCSK